MSIAKNRALIISGKACKYRKPRQVPESGAAGTQNRSSPNVVEAVAKLKEGVIGRVYIARGITFKSHPPIRPAVTEAAAWARLGQVARSRADGSLL